MKTLKSILLSVILLSVVFSSCNKNKTAPELPPESAFVANFSDFNDNGKALADSTIVNWGHAAINVGFWNAIITIGLAVPVASYVEAVKNHEAEYQGDNTWLWTYSFNAGVNTYSADLYGVLKSETVEWEMYITKSGEYEHFLWYSGISNLDRNHGTWTLYNKPADPTELLGIEWNRTTDSTGNIKYTNIVPGGAENGGYIFYGNDSNSDLNAYYNIYNKGEDNLIQIEWSQANQNGHVKNTKFFGDDIWHCWDETHHDVDCN